MLENFYRGDARLVKMSFKKKDGTPIDITGWKVYLTMKASLADADEDAALQKIQIVHTDAVNGLTEILINSEESAALQPRIYYCDVQLTDTVGNNFTVFNGKITVRRDITQS